MIKGESGFIPYVSRLTNKPSWLSYAPLSSSGWSLGIVFPRGELFSDINKLNRVVLALGLLGFVILFIILFLISVSITRPLEILADTTRDIGKGRLDFDLSVIKSGDEVGLLAESFIYMRDSLKKYIKELTETTAVKERMQSELKIAHDIQMGIVPKIFPPFPDRPEFDIYGVLVPAKEVGGDFYDFFFMDNERLCFAIGDVSDKGVPASLLMAVTKTMIKTMSKDVTGPDEILDRVNKEIAHDNDSCMFITIFCGILNVKTGEILYSNAGHTFPLVIRSGDGIEFLESDTCMAVGFSEEAVYRRDRLRLEPGDILCMYTDGVTEAGNRKEELFGPERLKEGIYEARHRPITGIVSEACSKVNEFAGGIPQADDITMLAIQYFGGQGRNKTPNEGIVILKNSASEIPRLAEAVRIFAQDNNMSEKAAGEITLALEEILANIQAYAYTDKDEHAITVILSLSGNEFTAKVVDDGRPFDPTGAPEPDIDKPLEERKLGGLGISLVRKLMDRIEYERREDKNILTIKKKV
jgi:sigma-B regulation protein RsbU (phosphoserine phosphatase)